MELPTAYNPKETENKIYKLWEESGYFNPDNLPGERKENFSIVLPPPNVTGILHMGSALMLVIEDILVRYARMQGKKTLWIPGTDSAAIATQARVEKNILKKEGKNRNDLGREELLKRIGRFVEENKSTILTQIRAMGSSIDWSRYAYTMDDERYKAVVTAFVRMYEAGLIYRGNRIVNWDPKGQTVISDDEIEYEERSTKLYTFRYWKDFPISISTTRPETKVGDTAVAVNPDDPRYKEFIGKEFSGEFAGAKLKIKIVADKAVEKDFGTGALGVTPAHSHIDWEISERFNLDRPQVINEFAKMTDLAGPLIAGLKATEAREKIVAWLKENGLLEKDEDIKHNISLAQRTGGVIEPLPKLQWFIAVNKEFTIPYSEIPGIKSGDKITLKDLMRKSVENGPIAILPDSERKKYFHWVDNLRDWCISRQIWFGHRIPIWYKGEEIFCGLEAPKDSSADEWEQDSDVLDTWFSSALWTFSTLGWPEKTEDLKKYHPTTVMETGYDILPFWVARMILMSGFHLGQIPFKTVYFHGLVRDERGRKISKSLGNNIDPMDMGEKYGTDAVRMSLIIGTAAGADSKISENKIKGYKHFANKLWNISRFVLMSLPEELDLEAGFTPEDKKLIEELRELEKDITKDMDNFRFYLAGEKIYHYIWHNFADKIIEESKAKLASEDPAIIKSAQRMLFEILIDSLKILHPFMPFVTEELWSKLPSWKDKQLLIIESWPETHNS
jgi:valyl-tRNA synthetase